MCNIRLEYLSSRGMSLCMVHRNRMLQYRMLPLVTKMGGTLADRPVNHRTPTTKQLNRRMELKVEKMSPRQLDWPLSQRQLKGKELLRLTRRICVQMCHTLRLGTASSSPIRTSLEGCSKTLPTVALAPASVDTRLLDLKANRSPPNRKQRSIWIPTISAPVDPCLLHLTANLRPPKCRLVVIPMEAVLYPVLRGAQRS